MGRAEVIIVDNGSRALPRGGRRGASPGCGWSRRRSPGPGPARNRGVGAGPRASPRLRRRRLPGGADWLPTILARFAADPALELLGGDIRVLPEVPGDPTPAEAYECRLRLPPALYIERQGFSVTANLAVRRAVFDGGRPLRRHRDGRGQRLGPPRDRDGCPHPLRAGHGGLSPGAARRWPSSTPSGTATSATTIHAQAQGRGWPDEVGAAGLRAGRLGAGRRSRGSPAPTGSPASAPGGGPSSAWRRCAATAPGRCSRRSAPPPAAATSNGTATEPQRHGRPMHRPRAASRVGRRAFRSASTT